MKKYWILPFLFLFLFSSCAKEQAETRQPAPVITETPIAFTETPFQPVAPSPVATEVIIPATPTIEATPTEFVIFYPPNTIPGLRTRHYGGGSLTKVGDEKKVQSLTRYAFQYPSDGLNIYGMMTVPDGEGPFPVIIAIHGYAEPTAYQSLTYSSAMLDKISRRGYIVIHPNMRNFLPSDPGEDLFRVGMTVDVMNLIAILKTQAGQSGLLEKADALHIGLWSHSMGGEVALRILTISPDVKAALLYSPLGGDSLQNAELLYKISLEPIYQEEMKMPADFISELSPQNFYDQVSAGILLFHGTADETIPISVSKTTCNELSSLAKDIECVFLADAGHTFASKYSDKFYSYTFAFYAKHLKGQ